MPELNEFEKAVVAALVRDDRKPRPERPPEIDALEVESRSLTGSGFITELRDSAEARAYPDDVSLRWGAKFVALINAEDRVGMVVYVDRGRIATVEAYTFGGRTWPREIRDVSVVRVESSELTPSNS